jgi:hypothetical protein
MQDFEAIGAADIDIDVVRETFQHAFERIWAGDAENDGADWADQPGTAAGRAGGDAADP